VREILKQGQYKPLRASEQIASLLSVTGGALDKVPTEKIREVERCSARSGQSGIAGIVRTHRVREKTGMSDRDNVMEKIKPAIAPFEEVEEANANN